MLVTNLYYIYKASLSFGRTSAGTVWCFLGMFHTIETNAKEYLIAELALNYIDQKNLESNFSTKLYFYMRKHQHRKSYNLTKGIFICPLDTKGERLVVTGGDIGKILKYP